MGNCLCEDGTTLRAGAHDPLMHTILPAFFQRLAWVPVRLAMRLRFSLEIKGVERLTGVRGNFIIASTHASELDPLLIVACLPFFSRHLPLFFASREKDFYADLGWRRFFYGATLFKMIGAYPVYAGLDNYRRALRHHLRFIARGHNVCIFPWGTRSLSGERPKAKGGVAFLARTTGLPVIPILIQGLEHVTVRDFFSGTRKVTVTFGNPLYAEDLFVSETSGAGGTERDVCEQAASVLMEKIFQQA